MITKFATVYAGHVDLPDRGQDATPANDRRFSNAHLASVFDKTEAIARVMDEGGWDTLWLAEHHFQQEGYEVIPNLLMAAVHAYLHRKEGDMRNAGGWYSRAGREPPTVALEQEWQSLAEEMLALQAV